MKNFSLFALIILLISQMAFAKTDFTLTAQASPELIENKSSAVTLFLSQQGKGIGENQLQTVHTEKIHALIIDPTLTDYQHIHPSVGKKTGEYIFDFTPHTQNAYRIWFDITPVNGKQEYIIVDLKGSNKINPEVIKKLNSETIVDGYHFKLTFDQPLTVGGHAMGHVDISDENGKPVTQLEPIMEAFAHIVAFNEDYKTILHIHPMGQDGSKIDFHIMPTEKGFVKLFVQVKISGKEIFAPFGVMVI